MAMLLFVVTVSVVQSGGADGVHIYLPEDGVQPLEHRRGLGIVLDAPQGLPVGAVGIVVGIRQLRQVRALTSSSVTVWVWMFPLIVGTGPGYGAEIVHHGQHRGGGGASVRW